MFDIGFPPALFLRLAWVFNSSVSPIWLISYQAPLKIIETYGFEVELVHQTSISMHGSSEGHQAYVYRSTRCRSPPVTPAARIVDPLFATGMALLEGSTEEFAADARARFAEAIA